MTRPVRKDYAVASSVKGIFDVGNDHGIPIDVSDEGSVNVLDNAGLRGIARTLVNESRGVREHDPICRDWSFVPSLLHGDLVADRAALQEDHVIQTVAAIRSGGETEPTTGLHLT